MESDLDDFLNNENVLFEDLGFDFEAENFDEFFQQEDEKFSPQEIDSTPPPSPNATQHMNSQVGGGVLQHEDMAVHRVNIQTDITQNTIGVENRSELPVFPNGNHLAVPDFSRTSTYNFFKEIKGGDLLLDELYGIAIVFIEELCPKNPLNREERRTKHLIIKRLDCFKLQIYFYLQNPSVCQWIKDYCKEYKKKGKK